MTGITLTLGTIAGLHYMEWAVNFDNWDVAKDGWSVKMGVQLAVVNFFVWTAVGILADLVVNFNDYFGKRLTNSRVVKFTNTNEGVIEISML